MLIRQPKRYQASGWHGKTVNVRVSVGRDSKHLPEASQNLREIKGSSGAPQGLQHGPDAAPYCTLGMI